MVGNALKNSSKSYAIFKKILDYTITNNITSFEFTHQIFSLKHFIIVCDCKGTEQKGIKKNNHKLDSTTNTVISKL